MMNLCDKNVCTGCGACYNICPKDAIKMVEDAEGFLYPKIDVKSCIECGLCEKICPVLHPIVKNSMASYPIAAISKHEDILMASSSGGVFSMLSTYVLNNGGIIFGAMMDDAYNVCHIGADNNLELALLRGSKYIQSNTKRTFYEVKDLLRSGRKVLYSGTPCQIAGLKAYLGHINTENLYTVDLVCHGVPSQRMFKTYINKLAEYKGSSPSDFQDFQFRKLDQWGVSPSYVKDGTRVLLSNDENLYMSLFLKNRLHRLSCYKCIYTTPTRVGDITLADFWGIGKKTPYEEDTSRGCSLVLINSDKGKMLFSEISSELKYELREWNEAIDNNPQLSHSATYPKDRDKTIDYLFNKSYKETYNKYCDNSRIRFNRWAGKILRRFHLMHLIKK